MNGWLDRMLGKAGWLGKAVERGIEAYGVESVRRAASREPASTEVQDATEERRTPSYA